MMKKIILIALVLTVTTVLGGTLAHSAQTDEIGKHDKPSRPIERLYGTWIAKDVEAETGEVKIRLTFRQENKVSLMAWSDIPFVGQVRDLKGSFSVHGNTITSEAIRDGKKAEFSFEQDQLVLRFKNGKVVRFNRK